jgi:hypothetical protein
MRAELSGGAVLPCAMLCLLGWGLLESEVFVAVAAVPSAAAGALQDAARDSGSNEAAARASALWLGIRGRDHLGNASVSETR